MSESQQPLPQPVFIIEDNKTYARYLQLIVQKKTGLECMIFNDGTEALQHLHLKPSIVTLDYALPDLEGAEVLRRLLSHDPDLSVLILSGQSNVGTAVQLLREGAEDYIPKNENTKELLENALDKILRNWKMQEKIEQLKHEVAQRYQPGLSIIGRSRSMQQVFGLMEKAARSEITVSIYGEPGTGKETMAKSIHHMSRRKDGPFVSVNISALTSQRIEEELFGSVIERDGRFEIKPGQFDLANEGTLYLAEITQLEPAMQARLVRVLQESSFTRVGSRELVQTNPRIIVSSTEDLAEEVGRGKFREDLYYRLLGLPITLPPLRERGDDVVLLAKQFLKEHVDGGTAASLSLGDEAKEKLLNFNFPGNVRELKAVIDLAAVMAEDEVIEAKDIKFQRSRRVEDLLNEELTLREYQRRIVKHYLDRYNNNVVEVAEKLDIGKSTIYRMMKTGEI
jgi:DNA-binding NtrC family response regulator